MTSPLAARLVSILPRLRRFAQSLTGAREEAEDLVQTACERALRGPIVWDPDTPLEHLMFRVIRNLWIDGIRRSKAAGRHEPIDGEALDLAGEDGRRTTEATLTLKNVSDRIAELPADQREVLMLVCVEDHSYADAAKALGIPIGTVMSRLARARQRLAEQLCPPRAAEAGSRTSPFKDNGSWTSPRSQTRH